MATKIVANTITISTSAAQVTASRFVRIYNSSTSAVANVQFGANSSDVSAMVTLGPTHAMSIDLGEMRPEYDGYSEKWISLAGAVTTVFLTPISAG